MNSGSYRKIKGNNSKSYVPRCNNEFLNIFFIVLGVKLELNFELTKLSTPLSNIHIG